MCIAERILIAEALSSEQHYDHFALISGLDYPVWSNQRIKKELADNPRKEYMKAYNLTLVKEPRKIPQRIKTYHFRDMDLHNENINKITRALLMRLMRAIPIKKKPFINARNKQCPVYGGSQWWILTRDCVEYVLHEMETNDEVNKYFKTSFAPDELLVQTIVCNSRYKENVVDISEDGIYPGLEKTTCTHYISYSGGQKIFTERDYQAIIDSGKMFFRKARTGISDRLMDMIDRHREKEYSNKDEE